MDISAISDVGILRKNNEDTIYFTNDIIGPFDNLFIIADGMGGHASGEVASRELVSTYCKYLKENDMMVSDYEKILKKVLIHCNDEIYKMSTMKSELVGMGTTATILTIKNGIGVIAHVGDSRLYVIKNNELYQKTIDHTYVYELFKKGKIKEEELKTHPNRNLITRAVGIGKTVKVDKLSIDLSEVEYILLCSDGLNSMLTDEEIKDTIINNRELELSEVSQKLVNKANEEGGNDNISVILIKL